MGVSTWDRDTGLWEGDSNGEKTKKPTNKDLDIRAPLDEIGDSDTDRPKVDIEDEGSGLNIIPAIPNTGNNREIDDEAVIRESIIREGILDGVYDQKKENGGVGEIN